MSLDVYLYGPTEKQIVACRECGHEREEDQRSCLFSQNITHNLTRMASEAGLYDCVWRPDEHGFTTARQLIEPLRTGIALMESDPPRFQQHNAKNGWGMYEHLLPWLRAYLAACEEHPDATIEVSR